MGAKLTAQDHEEELSDSQESRGASRYTIEDLVTETLR